jgi:hypothetical protein
LLIYRVSFHRPVELCFHGEAEGVLVRETATCSTAEGFSALISDSETGFEEVDPDWYREVGSGFPNPGSISPCYGQLTQRPTMTTVKSHVSGY